LLVFNHRSYDNYAGFRTRSQYDKKSWIITTNLWDDHIPYVRAVNILWTHGAKHQPIFAKRPVRKNWIDRSERTNRIYGSSRKFAAIRNEQPIWPVGDFSYWWAEWKFHNFRFERNE
jgi:hypothetical protein